MADTESDAIRALEQALKEVSRLFGQGASSGVVDREWLRARMYWSDAVAEATEERFYKPLIRDVEALNSGLRAILDALKNL